MSYYYGELLWTLENWKDAAEQYTKVVEMNPKGKYVKDAAYAAVLAWKNALNVDDHEHQDQVEGRPGQAEGARRERRRSRRWSIPEYQKKMIGAFDTYIKYVPDAPELVTIKYRKARIYYEYNHFDEAAKLFEDIVREVPEARAGDLLGQPAARLAERAGQDQGGRELGRQVPRDAGAHEGPRVRQADDLAQERHLRHGRPRVREGEELQGVRPLDAGRRRGPSGSPEARRAALERRPVLPERAPRRPGAQGARRS